MTSRYSIVGLGEVLWDLLPSGPQMGGAPANFTCHVHALGADACLVSRVGEDDLGRKIIARLGTLGVRTEHISRDALHPTGTVSVELVDGQPGYIIHNDVAWDFIEASPGALAAAGAADAICFGTLAQRSETSRAAIQTLARAAAPQTLRVCDVNLRQHFYSRKLLVDSLALANVVKLNDAELPVLGGLIGLSGGIRSQLTALVKRFALRLIVLTRGADGSILYDGRSWSEHPGIRTDVKDTVGAGDSFTAAAVLGLLEGWSLHRINTAANEVAAFVCTQTGATPAMPAQLRSLFQKPTDQSHA